MIPTVDNLRKRTSVLRPKIQEKIGLHQRKLLYHHDYFTFFYVGISLVMSLFTYGGLIVSGLYFIDFIWMEKATTKSQMKKLYQSNLLFTGLLGLSSYTKYIFQLHIVTCIVPVLYIIHRRNKQNVFLELVWVLGWLLLKIGLSWIVTFQYMNIAGKLYSNWLMNTNTTPLINPWTNPPVIALTVISFINSFVNLIESYYVIIHDKRLI